MLKISTLLLFAFAQFGPEPPSGPATAPNPAYPLRVHILVAQRSSDRSGYYHGFGRGNLVGTETHGIDYTYECSHGFLHNYTEDEFYQARWKKPNQVLEILLQPVGSNKVEKCDVKVTVKAEAYGRNGAVAAKPGVSAAPAVNP